ncbi:multisubunit sodium/proton antiporter, MrpE subunit (TC 2.A.63.1) [Desulfonatronum thiosulfatophilum]|uniref:Multisubunit sodium/proton antiporter, MrpE subunit (TC 2.A.63.1) n=1 Tax=Desulfonatronum thiosulfatophilum TaxID=617002 RepID=A0A1G6ENF5_9BACT|nr:Na+/H+ antiporter subunit E [Desulfonatronum thiosulfatophilum]SDB58816.1 multisubunit sodium/proton antiporter, MrpE subunit (TC 2.A.63.1) [Desulfonatronum thiosulfatophilum]
MQAKTSSWFRYRGLIIQALLLTAVWLILSGRTDPIYLFWGFISIAFVMWMSSRLHDIPLTDNKSCGSTRIIIPRLIAYLFWLVWQIIKSGVYVAYVVLHPKMPIEPMIVRFTSKQPNVIARVILGNSITLTPGTFTLDIEDNLFTVHALTRDTEEDLVSGDMERRVARLYMQECQAEDMCCDIELITSGRGK